MDYDSNSGSPGSFDLIGLAKQVIYDVDGIRSLSNENSTNGQSNGGYEESRVSAFFRLIGLPMFVNVDPEKTSGTILNTGYGSYLSSKIENMESVGNVINFIPNNLNGILSLRETMYISEENSTEESRSSAMSASLRTMVPLAPYLVNEKAYTIGQISPIYIYDRNVFKMLFPLIPSYKKINPSNRNVARPFSNNLEIYRDESLRKPFIETVILIRFVFGQSSASDKGNKNYQEVLKTIQNSTNKEDYAKIQKSVGMMQSSEGEEFIIGNIFNSLSQLAFRYLELQSQQEYLASLGGKFTVNLQTESSKDTFGKKVSSIMSGDFDETSRIGSKLKESKQKLAKEQTRLLLLTGDSSVSVPSDKTNNASNSLLSSLFIDLLKKKGDTLEREIKNQEEDFKKLSVEADKLRVEIDLMTGEFCGLSMIDVIAVIASLFLIDEKNFFALLDKETKETMSKNAIFKNLKYLGVSENEVGDAVNAVSELHKYVIFIYGYINSLIGSVNDRTKRNTTVPKNQKVQERKTDSNY